MGIGSSVNNFFKGSFGSTLSEAFADAATSLSNISQSAVNRGMASESKNFINATLNVLRNNADDAQNELKQQLEKTLETINKSGVTKEIVDELKSHKGLVDDDIAKPFIEKAGLFDEFIKNASIENAEKFLGRAEGTGLGPLNYASGFLKDATYGKTRTAAMIGGGVGLGVTTRLLSGGDLTHNARGERDIAGLPFI